MKLTSTLELCRRDRRPGGIQTERTYLDFIVDGRSLQELLQPGDLIGCLGWGSADAERRSVQQLLLRAPSEIPSGRVALYVCPECGDLACGAITVRIEEGPDGFVWREFGFERGYDEALQENTSYLSVGPFLFNKTDYWQCLQQRLGAHSD